MKSRLNLLCIVFIIAYALPVNATELGKFPILENFQVDSIAIAILPDLFTTANITRENFDSWKKICTETTLRDKSEIHEVLDAIRQCVVDSILSHKTDQVVKEMKILKRGNKYYTVWFGDDRLDIRCRMLFFCDNHVLVAWLAETGGLDFDRFSCSNGQIVLKTIRKHVLK